jgi:hypothetical protein
MSKRTDIHCPSRLIPSDYVEVLPFAHGSYLDNGYNIEVVAAMHTGVPQRMRWYGFGPAPKGWVGEMVTAEKVPFFRDNPWGGCHCCGAHFRFGSVMRYVPTGEHIVIGHICAEKLAMLVDFEQAHSMRRSITDRSKRAQERMMRFVLMAGWVRENREAVRQLRALRQHTIGSDMRRKLIQWGSLSEKQVAFIAKLAAEAARPAEKHVALPNPGTRQVITGTVVSLRWVSGFGYGASDVPKITVKVETPAGSWLCYGTAPDALLSELSVAQNAERQAWVESSVDAYLASGVKGGAQDRTIPEPQGLRGRRVTFTAKLEAGRDPHFGFFSRPTKAALILDGRKSA